MAALRRRPALCGALFTSASTMARPWPPLEKGAVAARLTQRRDWGIGFDPPEAPCSIPPPQRCGALPHFSKGRRGAGRMISAPTAKTDVCARRAGCPHPAVSDALQCRPRSDQGMAPHAQTYKVQNVDLCPKYAVTLNTCHLSALAAQEKNLILSPKKDLSTTLRSAQDDTYSLSCYKAVRLDVL